MTQLKKVKLIIGTEYVVSIILALNWNEFVNWNNVEENIPFQLRI